MSDTDDLDALIDSGTRLLGIPLRPEWRGTIRQHLAVSLQCGLAMLDFPLPDEADPAFVFTA